MSHKHESRAPRKHEHRSEKLRVEMLEDRRLLAVVTDDADLSYAAS